VVGATSSEADLVLFAIVKVGLLYAVSCAKTAEPIEMQFGMPSRVGPGNMYYMTPHPFPQIDIIGAMVIVWRIRGKIIRSVLCNIVCNNCAQCNAHTYEQT